MSISPPSDIILDVARAADPAKLRAATARFDATPTADGAFEAALDSELAATPAPPELPPASPATAPPPPPRPPALLSPATTAATPSKTDRDFEAMVLAQLFQSMMPQDETMFGSGTEGSVWSGLFFQELGKAVAAKGGIGIAAALAKDPNLHGAGVATADQTTASSAILAGLADTPSTAMAGGDGALWGDQ